MTEITADISVLNDGFVRVVDTMGDDAAIVNAARVSYGEGTKSVSDDRALIRYLVRHFHTSPLEMCSIKFHCRMPIFVARQFVRHRTAKINELSARYSHVPDSSYMPEDGSIGRQSTINRQGRESGLADVELDRVVRNIMDESWRAAYSSYQDLIEHDVARELARAVLPVSAYTEWYWKIDLNNLFHFLKLRTDSHAQLEIRLYAEAIESIVAEWVPIAYQAWVDYQKEAVTLSRMEADIMHEALSDRPHIIRKLIELRADMSAREKREFLERW
jgi:thymidylate synthase (FAD)